MEFDLDELSRSWSERLLGNEMDYQQLVREGHALTFMKDHVLPILRKPKKPVSKSYRYMVTFTLTPKQADKAEEAEAMIRAIADREALHIERFYLVKEHTKAGVPHWHAAVETTKALSRNRFQYYEALYGHVNLSVTKAKSIAEALNYMSKESIPELIKDTRR